MSENAENEKKPANLLLEIDYSHGHVGVDYYKDGECIVSEGIGLGRDLDGKKLERIVREAIEPRLGKMFCGITVELARSSDSDTVICVYKLPEHCRDHRLKVVNGSIFEADRWLQSFLVSAGPVFVDRVEQALGITYFDTERGIEAVNQAVEQLKDRARKLGLGFPPKPFSMPKHRKVPDFYEQATAVLEKDAADAHKAAQRMVSDLKIDHDDGYMDFKFGGKDCSLRFELRQTGRNDGWAVHVGRPCRHI